METLLTAGASALGFILVLLTIPPVLRVARAKHLYEPFEERKIHTKTVPPLGGVPVFIGFSLSVLLLTNGYDFAALKYIIAAVIMVFFIGLKDDILVISARKKFMIQVLAAGILVIPGGIRITHLHGMLGFTGVPEFWSVVFTLFLILTITNAFNLIDGIDGLASGLAMMASTILGVWFYISGHYHLSILSFALLGSLTAFFLYNVFGHTNKIFLGDSGAMITGMILSVLIVEFNQLNLVKTAPFAIGAAPSVSFAILIVPLIDMLRVIVIRLRLKKSPFVADNNHIHHRLLKLVPSHFHVTMIIVSANAAMVGLALLFNHISFNRNMQFLMIFIIGALLSTVPAIILRVKSGKPKTAEERTEEAVLIH